ncbi:DUF2622 domain-containing protein [Yersinia enterocolitica]|uniref:type V toxin-antitoxin system endoribonuclease antitoxin GhoS n=1 Tax=Yersinia enterocolitica TaxID=630 RepID=UPI0030B34D36
MSRFTVRIELHNADSDEYESLHEKMEAKGYSREITATSGKTYRLPDAEYTYSSSTKDEGAVADDVQSIANSVKAKSGVMVTKSAGSAIRGLKTI